MRFEVGANGGNCSSCVWTSAIGVITEETPADFERFLDRSGAEKGSGKGGQIFLHSPGGGLLAGLALGQLFREYGYSTQVGETINDVNPDYIVHDHIPGTCESACAYAFLGGENRWLLEGSRLGFHQFHKDPILPEIRLSAEVLEQINISATQLTAGLIAAYLTEMEVDGKVLTLASLVSPGEMVYPPEELLYDLDVLTREGFGDWWIEPYNDGVIAVTKEENPLTPQKQLTAFCSGPSSKFSFMITTAPSGMRPKVSRSDELVALIFDAEITIDGNYDLRIPKTEIEARLIPDQAAHFVIPIPRESIDRILTAKDIKIWLNFPMVVFRPNPYAEVNLSDQARAMLRIASRNCV